MEGISSNIPKNERAPQKPAGEIKNVPEKEIFSVEIEGKKYEVMKSHFSYPENIIQENGGVEGYDRFQLSWDKLDKKDLGVISERLGIGTEMSHETISHYVNAIQRSNTWNDNRFFLNKTFDLTNCVRQIQKTGGIDYYYPNLLVFKDGQMVNVLEDLKAKYPQEDLEGLVGKSTIKFSAYNLVQNEGKYKNVDLDQILNYLNDKDVVSGFMSFAQGSNLSTRGAGGIEGHDIYSTPFFNFNKHNAAFLKYIENAEKFQEGLENSVDRKKIAIQTSGTHGAHPRISMLFTQKFPAFRWCYADTAYVPMKDGPNFFKFYSKEEKTDPDPHTSV